MNGIAPATLIRAKREHRRLDAAAWQALASGATAERFAHMVAALGGPGDVLEHPGRHLATAPVQRAVPAARDGHAAAQRVQAAFTLADTLADAPPVTVAPWQWLDSNPGEH